VDRREKKKRDFAATESLQSVAEKGGRATINRRKKGSEERTKTKSRTRVVQQERNKSNLGQKIISNR